MEQNKLDLEILDELSITHIPNDLPPPLVNYVQELVHHINSIKENPADEYNRI